MRGETTNGGERASVLLVDDRPEKLVALRAVLADLDVDLVCARSGREALRSVLQREFAAILLDVHMPGMDGFETAALIRERPSSERTPILFVTAYSEDTHVARGYSLGAVDYIVTPIVPDVLRSKVAVFVELFNAVRREREHADALERHTRRLARLNAASQAINSGASTDEILEAAMRAARDILGATRCAAGLSIGDRRIRVRHLGGPGGAAAAALEDLIVAHGRALRGEGVRRIAGEELQTLLADACAPAVDGLLASLVGHEGRHLGILCIAGEAGGRVYEREDEALFLQLARMTGIAIENLLFSLERETNQLKEEFLSTLSHELRTPLTAILGWVRLLRQGRLDAAVSERALGIIERNVKIQGTLIDDMLDISRIATGKFRLTIQPVSIPELLDAAVTAAGPMAEAKSLEMVLRIEDGLEPIAGDGDRLQQVIWNLLTNAIKFTPSGGRIDVRAERRDGTVVVHVADTGKGIVPEFLPHVFERFRQADGGPSRLHGGLGIGLAVVRHIVELHGGTVQATSDGVGRGARFTVSLPTIPAVAAPRATQAAEERLADPEPPPAPRVSLAGARVLVVDDDADTQVLLRQILKAHGADVQALGSALEARRAVDACKPDLLISDLGMPEEDGWQLMEELRARYSDAALPAIALSAYAGEADRKRSRAAGYDAHLAKPVEPADLVEVVAELLLRRASAGAQPAGTDAEDRDQLAPLGDVPLSRGGSS